MRVKCLAQEQNTLTLAVHSLQAGSCWNSQACGCAGAKLSCKMRKWACSDLCKFLFPPRNLLKRISQLLFIQGLACTLFQKQISTTFSGLLQDSDWFFKGSKIHITPYTPKISMLILLTAFHTLHIFLVEFNTFPELSRASGLFPGLSSLGNCHYKISGLSGFPGLTFLRKFCIFFITICRHDIHLLIQFFFGKTVKVYV